MFNEHMTESEALQDQYDYEDDDIYDSYDSEADERELRAYKQKEARRNQSIKDKRKHLMTVVDKMLSRYKIADEAKIGEEILCACCAKKTIKTTYHKKFCSNGKTKNRRGNNCKDKYWNTVDDSRRHRATTFNKE